MNSARWLRKWLYVVSLSELHREAGNLDRSNHQSIMSVTQGLRRLLELQRITVVKDQTIGQQASWGFPLRCATKPAPLPQRKHGEGCSVAATQRTLFRAPAHGFPRGLSVTVPPGTLSDRANASRVFCAIPQVCSLPWGLWSLFGWGCPVGEGRRLSMRKHVVPHHVAAEQGSAWSLPILVSNSYEVTCNKIFSCFCQESLPFCSGLFCPFKSNLIKKWIKIFLPSRDEIYFRTATTWTIRKIQRS